MWYQENDFNFKKFFKSIIVINKMRIFHYTSDYSIKHETFFRFTCNFHLSSPLLLPQGHFTLLTPQMSLFLPLLLFRAPLFPSSWLSMDVLTKVSNSNSEVVLKERSFCFSPILFRSLVCFHIDISQEPFDHW